LEDPFAVETLKEVEQQLLELRKANDTSNLWLGDNSEESKRVNEWVTQTMESLSILCIKSN